MEGRREAGAGTSCGPIVDTRVGLEGCDWPAIQCLASTSEFADL